MKLRVFIFSSTSVLFAYLKLTPSNLSCLQLLYKHPFYYCLPYYVIIFQFIMSTTAFLRSMLLLSSLLCLLLISVCTYVSVSYPYQLYLNLYSLTLSASIPIIVPTSVPANCIELYLPLYFLIHIEICENNIYVGPIHSYTRTAQVVSSSPCRVAAELRKCINCCI